MSSGSAPVSGAGEGLVAARLGAVLERHVVQLVSDAVAAVARRVLARLKAPAERDRLALDQVLRGGLGLRAPEHELHVHRVAVTVAPVAGQRDGGDALAAARAAQLDVAGDAAVAGEGEHLR